ncbi:M23 family metallopeptidase [Altericroceibacterium spongiae]|uniref:M23 family metallopeptidase n=1 Tax=Altericroceibacterium spongiae TaxID=2320269 RepID=A0A420EEH9_9SPHN|nr:M23 family metallopeptidase [Altericroceibacterium spongiae]RKF19068.1 M23 family metallopeptidase [Altericroceibacterium spongiae]
MLDRNDLAGLHHAGDRTTGYRSSGNEEADHESTFRDEAPQTLHLRRSDAHPIQHRRRQDTSWGEAFRHWRDSLSDRFEKLDLAPDLAQNIGSARWLRGLATLIVLCMIAFLCWPDFAPVEAAPAMKIDDRARDEFRSQMIMPLALGGDSGRHMGATRSVVPLAAAPERPSLEFVATLSKGDSFARMLQRAGIGKEEAGHLADIVGKAMPLSDIEPGTQVDIVLGRRPAKNMPRLLDSLSFRARFDLQLAVERRNGRLQLAPHPIRVDDTPLRVRGEVGASLYRSARAAGAPPRAIQQYLRQMGQELNIQRDIKSTDQFDLMLDYKRAATGDVEPGDLLYAAIIRDGKPVKQLMRWGEKDRFFESSGEGVEQNGLMAPVPGYVTSRYGMRRHPILGYKRMHAGMDFKATYGTPIHAASDGKVVYAGRHGGHGNFVKLDHGGGLATGYAHMSRIAVHAGSYVKRGQVIGYVGSTGLSTGPHLHYEMYRNGHTVNPASVKFVQRAQLAGSELGSFRAEMAKLQTIPVGAALESLPPDPAMQGGAEREIDRVEQPQKLD